jgi:general secretion pathway protein B
MSFILDALKKSESDRQRQSGPALFEVRVATPRAQFPPWAIAVAALLVINMGVVAWLLLRRPSHADSPPAAAAGAPAPASGSAAAPVANQQAYAANGAGRPQASGEPTLGAASMAPRYGAAPAENNTPVAPAGYVTQAPAQQLPANPYPAGNYPPVAQGTQGAPGAQMGAPGPAGGQFSGQYAPAAAGPAGAVVGSAGAPAPPQTGTPSTAPPPGANPDDYTPATESANPIFKGHVKRATENGYTLYQDAALVPGANLPELRLDLHVFAARPEERFALINMHRMHEGDSLPDGVRVESIVPEGVVLSHNGSKFLLPRD